MLVTHRSTVVLQQLVLMQGAPGVHQPALRKASIELRVNIHFPLPLTPKAKPIRE